MFVTILIVAALILFVLAGFDIGKPKVHLGWLGAACVALTFLLGAFGPR